MKAEFLKGINHVHFIGINGSSMSGLAILLFEKGIRVTGSDIEHTYTMDKLISMGIDVYIPHDSS
ncbi:MAG TPA: Mur ligase domain-containing protein, partial [Clostridia bacterium]|nr:Mur ligase domain-containing protein [Clostridia bacterium]